LKFLRMKEPGNTLTHFIPFLAAIAGLVILLNGSASSPSKIVTSTIFGLSAILLYGASTLYHWIRTTPEKTLLLRKIDHIAIFFLIAGTYTPVSYFGLEGAWKWSILIIVWSIVAIGTFLKIFFMNMPRWISTVLYLGLGWIAIIPIAEFIKNLSTGAIVFMVLGGISYTIGGIIYGTKPFRYFHEVFHCFVALGTFLHFCMIYFFVITV